MSVRSLAEMRFAVSLSPCPKCGAPGPTKVDFYGDGNLYSYAGRCPSCNEPRNFDFKTDGDPMDLPTFHRHHLGGAEPSTIIKPEQFAAELRRLEPNLHADPSEIPLASWSEQSAINDRAVTAAIELCKFPNQSAAIAERDRLIARANRFKADAPRIWMLKTGNKLHVSEEIRGVLNQLTEDRAPTLEQLRTYFGVRGEVLGDTVKLPPAGDVESMRVREDADALVVELAVRRATVADVEEEIGRTRPAANGQLTATKTYWKHDIRFDVVSGVSGVTNVTIRIPHDHGN